MTMKEPRQAPRGNGQHLTTDAWEGLRAELGLSVRSEPDTRGQEMPSEPKYPGVFSTPDPLIPAQTLAFYAQALADRFDEAIAGVVDLRKLRDSDLLSFKEFNELMYKSGESAIRDRIVVLNPTGLVYILAQIGSADRREFSTSLGVFYLTGINAGHNDSISSGQIDTRPSLEKVYNSSKANREL